MLSFLKNLLSGSSKAPKIDCAFAPFSRAPFRIGPVPLGEGAVGFGAVGSAPWFNPVSAADRRLLLSSPSAVLETDSLDVLKQIGSSELQPHAEFLIYQPWREPLDNGARMLGALVESMAQPIGEAVKGSPVRNLFLVSGGFSNGGLTSLEKHLGGHKLDSLGLFWYYSGDDITDDLRVIDEIASLCRSSSAKRLSLLTAEMSDSAEERLVKQLETVPSITKCVVFEKDDNARYKPFSTPSLDALLSGR